MVEPMSGAAAEDWAKARTFHHSLFSAQLLHDGEGDVTIEGEEHWLTRGLLPCELTIAEQIERAGAVAGATRGVWSTTSRGMFRRV